MLSLPIVLPRLPSLLSFLHVYSRAFQNFYSLSCVAYQIFPFNFPNHPRFYPSVLPSWQDYSKRLANRNNISFVVLPSLSNFFLCVSPSRALAVATFLLWFITLDSSFLLSYLTWCSNLEMNQVRKLEMKKK